MPRPKPTFDTYKCLLDGLNYTIDTNNFNVNTKIIVTCDVGHEYHTSITMIKSLGKNPRICPHCLIQQKRLETGISFVVIEDKVKSMGFQIVNKKDFYKREGETLHIKCPHDGYIHHIKCLRHFMSNDIRITCPTCSIPKTIINNLEEHNNNIIYKKSSIHVIPSIDYSVLPIALHKKIKSQNKWNLIEYTGTRRKAKYQCADCGFIKETMPYAIFNGRGMGCLGCKKNITHTYLYEKIRNICNVGNIYMNSDFKYESVHSPIQFTCNQCGELFDLSWAEITGRYYKVRCPKCYTDSKRKEQSEVYDFVQSLNVNPEHENNTLISPQEIDIVCHDKKVAIEYSGVIWHSTKYKKETLYHRNKMIRCSNVGYRFIMLFDDEWTTKRKVCESRIKSILGVSSHRIFARKCEIQRVSDTDSMRFCRENHIQGSPAVAHVSYGLFHNNTMISCMIFTKRVGKISTSVEAWEMVRYCCLLDHSIPGSASKLLAAFKKEYRNIRLVTFSDLRWGDSDFYRNLGFSEDKTLPPDYTYAGSSTTWTRKHKFGFDKKRLITMCEKKNIPTSLNDTETTLSLKLDLYKVYDCGHKRYILKT